MHKLNEHIYIYRGSNVRIFIVIISSILLNGNPLDSLDLYTPVLISNSHYYPYTIIL